MTLPATLPQTGIPTRLTCRYSTAATVTIAGDFNGWSPTATPLVLEGGGLWGLQLDLSPGSHEYRLVVDGRWISDPQADGAVPNPFGDLNSVVVVPRAGP
jgi:1,4-alpha-glucan branching enzyme